MPSGTQVRYELQTNGTLLSDAWLDLFERYEVAVGVSLDGPPRANDRHRLSHAGRSSAASAVRGIELLRSRPQLFAGLLAVVDLANDPAEVHDYLAAFAPPVIDFGLPHATHDDPPHRGDPSVPEYGLWMSKVYDTWLAQPEHRHSVRMLEDIVALSSGVRGSVETLGLAPPTSVVIESDGSIEGGGGYLPHRFSAADGYRNPSVYCADLEYLIRHVQGSLRQHGWDPYAQATSSS
ncbi:hypothetical protein ACIQGO_07990 [Streptomyces shenzhenensis]|uniref:hypothetical protein n=1 Tax=Streptomyces shenzhenensis TaxID=943815 RepID=UPI00381570D0